LLHPHSWGPEAAITVAGEPLVTGAPAARGTVEIAKGTERMRLRFLNPPDLGARLAVYPGAETYRPYLQVDTPPADAVVMVTLCELGGTTADDVALEVVDGLVDLSCRVSGKACRIRLALAGSAGESPRLKVSVGRRTLLESRKLAVPADTPG
jgi:hypothetical protein